MHFWLIISTLWFLLWVLHLCIAIHSISNGSTFLVAGVELHGLLMLANSWVYIATAAFWKG